MPEEKITRYKSNTAELAQEIIDLQNLSHIACKNALDLDIRLSHLDDKVKDTSIVQKGEKPFIQLSYIDDDEHPGLFVKRVSARCQKIFDDEFEKLLQLREKSYPDSNEFDKHYLIQKMKKLHKNAWDTIKNKISALKAGVISYIGMGTVMIVLGAVTIVFGPLLPALLVVGAGLCAYGAAAYGFNKLNHIHEQYESVLQSGISKELDELVRKHEPIYDNSVKQINKAFNDMDVFLNNSAKLVKSSKNKISRLPQHFGSVSVANQSMFTQANKEASAQPELIEHLQPRRGRRNKKD